jgi:hypothetical protein
VLFDTLTRLAERQRPFQAPVDGTRLRLAGPGAWFADRELVYPGGARLPVRMVVFEDPVGELTLYSPVDLDGGTVEALAGIGTVRRIVAPNRFHSLFVGRAMETYPDARLLVPAADNGLAERHGPRVEIVRTVYSLGRAGEIFPVSLRPGLIELVVYADRSELLSVADLLFNLHQAMAWQRWIYRLDGVWRRPAVSRLQRLVLLRDAHGLAAFYRWAMAKPFSRISMAHGLVISTRAREIFYQLFHRYAERVGR